MQTSRLTDPSHGDRSALFMALALGFGLALPAGLAQASPLTLPNAAEQIATDQDPSASVNLAVGPWKDGTIPAQPAEGAVLRNAWRIDLGGQSTLDLLRPLRGQADAAGYELLYECETLACGGFDFRYGIDLLPEPEMHVDLGDFRYLSAMRQGPKGPEYLAIMVSRSSTQGFVQVTEIGPMAARPPVIAASSMSEATPTTSPIEQALTRGPMVLEDLVFAPGKADLAPGTYPSLAELAAWLAAHPGASIELVGHTDAQGKPEANLALSRQRAEAVRQALLAGASIDPAQVTARGEGPNQPRADNDTPEGRQKNRRVEAVLAGGFSPGGT